MKTKLFYLMIFLIPFGAYRQVPGASKFLSLSWLLGFLLVLGMGIQIVVTKKWPASLRSSLWPALGLYFLIHLVSGLVSDYSLASLHTLGLLAVANLFFALNLVFITHQNFRRTLPLVLVASISASSFLSILGSVFHVPAMTTQMDAASAFERWAGGALDPNNLAAMITFNLPLLAHFFFLSERLWKKGLVLAVLGAQATALILTYSRSGAVVFTAVLGMIFVQHARRFKPKHFGFALGLSAAALATLILLIPPSYVERLKSTFKGVSDKAIERRLFYLDVARQALEERPVLGSGPGTFREIYAASGHAVYYARKKGHEPIKISQLKRFAHNTYLEILTGTGILGLVSFLTLAFITLRSFHKGKKRLQNLCRDEEMTSLAGSFAISFFSLLIFLMMFSDMFHKYLWLSMALSQVALKMPCEDRSP